MPNRMDEVRVIAVDWSGSKKPSDQRRTIWTAEIVGGRLVSLEGGRRRDEVGNHLVAIADRSPRVIVGLDFAFSLPAWYLKQQGIASAGELWQRVAAESLTDAMRDVGLDNWMGAPDAPFWKARGCAPPPDKRFRKTELELRARGFQPKSVFQLVGVGQVGPASLRGMQTLHRLREAGFHVWPFDPPELPLVVEVYPALYRRFIHERAPSDNQHARDAAISALAMWRSLGELLALRQESTYSPEGKIWHPSAAEPAADGVVVVRRGQVSERQKIGYTVGVSAEVCGSTGLSLSYVVVPPGGVAEAHWHYGYETAIYQLSGRVETRFGTDLAESVVTEAGDFLFIPPGVPHRPRNLSGTEPAAAVVARNDARDDERVVPYETA
jgi:uncharacterized RmlC-like cupin family protein